MKSNLLTLGGGQDSEDCNKRLVSMLSGVMIRRTHADQVLGAALITLPRNTEKTIILHFNRVERYIYEIIRARCIKMINS